MSLKEEFEQGKAPRTAEDKAISAILDQLDQFRPETQRVIMAAVNNAMGIKTRSPNESVPGWGDH